MAAHLAKTLAPEELIDRSICPVKKEYVRSVAPRQYVKGSRKEKPQPKGKKGKQEKGQGYVASKDGLCFHFARNTCTFGEKCRFSHDMIKYLAQRPPDLPGKCPFVSQSECPYQITCRWASTHKNPDRLTTEHLLPYLKSKQGTEAEAQNAPEAAAEPTATTPEATAETSCSGVTSTEALDATGTQPEQSAALAAPETSSEPANADTENPSPVAAAAAEGTEAGATADKVLGPTPEGGAVAPSEPVKVETLELPVADSIEQPVNNLCQTLVHDLRKYSYDFSRADQQLARLGLSNNLQRKDRKPKGKPSSPPAQQPAKPAAAAVNPASREAGAVAAPEATVAAPAVNGGETVGEGTVPTGADGAEAGAAAATDVEMKGGENGTAPPAAAPADASAPSADTKRPAAAAATSPGSPGQAAKRQCVGDGASPVPIYDISRSSNLDGGLQKRDRKPHVDFRGKLYCAPLTTSGNLPFRRVVKHFGCDITCGEMALTANLLQGQQSEWALLKRHPSEDIFGVQICGAHPDSVARCVQLLDDTIEADFIDINMGCPIDLICSKGMGSAMLTKPKRMEYVVRAAAAVSQNAAVTFKTRTGYADKDRQRCAAEILAGCGDWGAAAVTLHGRTRNQRYSRLADWEYVEGCAEGMPEGVQLIGNGDVLSWEEYALHMRSGKLSTCMIARGALIKPWIFTEIKEERHWDITSGERLEMLKNFCSWGLQHWGSDSKGVETTRSFLLEWLSFLCRYVPVGLMEVVPQRMTWRPPPYVGRNDLETLMASTNALDWVRISEMLLGPAPQGFSFVPKHKSNAYVDSRDEEVQG